ncbi:MAG: GNAT family N-acetyltransferase [Succinivibrio sp.]
MEENLYDLAEKQNSDILRTNRFSLRGTSQEDAEDLLKVYSDPLAQPLFNSDNCHGDDFCYETLERMRDAIDFWSRSYAQKQFVRFSVTDLKTSEAIGTIELFVRHSDDYFTNCGILRLDMRSDYEQKDFIIDILSVIKKIAMATHISFIATKAKEDCATQRIAALTASGYVRSEQNLIGFDGTKYGSYYELRI